MRICRKVNIFRTAGKRVEDSPKGNRTPVIAVRGRCPRPLDDGTKVNWGGRIRTITGGVRVRCPAIRRLPNRRDKI